MSRLVRVFNFVGFEHIMKPYYEADYGKLYHGHVLDVLKDLPDQSVNCCVTSPPYYGLRDYGVPGQIGLEETPQKYIEKMVSVFNEVRRVLADDGTCWINIGDSYANGGRKTRDPGKSKIHPAFEGDAYQDGKRPDDPDGIKPKDLLGIPWMLAFALRDNSWYLRQDIIWHKPNPMPESVKDRCTKAHEYIFLLSKSQKYFCDMEAVKEKCLLSSIERAKHSWNGDTNRGMPSTMSPHSMKCFGLENPPENRNKRSVWTCSTKPFSGAHFAVFPPNLIEPCILAGCPKGGVVLDPFMGSGTTAIVAHKHDRKFIGIELNQKYLDEIAIPRIEAEAAQLRLFVS